LEVVVLVLVRLLFQACQKVLSYNQITKRTEAVDFQGLLVVIDTEDLLNCDCC